MKIHKKTSYLGHERDSSGALLQLQDDLFNKDWAGHDIVHYEFYCGWGNRESSLYG